MNYRRAARDGQAKNRATSLGVQLPSCLRPSARRYTAAVAADFESRIVELLQVRTDVVAAYLFGSTARGESRADSDVDVAVLFEPPPVHTLNGLRLSLEGALERALGVPVDLVVLNDAPVDLRARILRDGRLLVDRDRAARIRFEVRTRNEAFDLQPVLDRYRAPRS
jgi:predicted nucleotidyltransferase